jgi:hypothetical protein
MRAHARARAQERRAAADGVVGFDRAVLHKTYFGAAPLSLMIFAQLAISSGTNVFR